jgi:hypothetical protein
MDYREDSNFLEKNRKTTIKEGTLKKIAISMSKKRGIKAEEVYSDAITEINKKAR